MQGKFKILIIGLSLFMASSLFAQTPEAPRIAYESVPDFIKMPQGLYMGEAMGGGNQFARRILCLYPKW